MEVLIFLKKDDDTQNHRVPANTNPAPNYHPHPTILCSLQGKERRGQRGADESLNRPEEGHTGAMAIPKTPYLLSHNDSGCQNNCQDTQPARNWLTCRLPNQATTTGVSVFSQQRRFSIISLLS